jgi:hypothetical protein
MNHPITLGGLLLSLGVIVGVPITASGFIWTFSEGMKPAPDAGDGWGGCLLALVGIVLTIGCSVGLMA